QQQVDHRQRHQRPGAPQVFQRSVDSGHAHSSPQASQALTVSITFFTYLVYREQMDVLSPAAGHLGDHRPSPVIHSGHARKPTPATPSRYTVLVLSWPVVPPRPWRSLWAGASGPVIAASRARDQS